MESKTTALSQGERVGERSFTFYLPVDFDATLGDVGGRQAVPLATAPKSNQGRANPPDSCMDPDRQTPTKSHE